MKCVFFLYFYDIHCYICQTMVFELPDTNV